MKLDEIWRRRPLGATAPPGTFSQARLNPIGRAFRTAPAYCLDDEPLAEARRKPLKSGEKGGIIVFSTDVNAALERQPGLLGSLRQWLRSWYQTIVNRLTRKRKVSNILGAIDIRGFSLGNYFRGYYKSDSGKIYSEKSLALEVLYINSAELEELATEIARAFQQETVLVKDLNNNQIYFADRGDVQTNLDTTSPP